MDEHCKRFWEENMPKIQEILGGLVLAKTIRTAGRHKILSKMPVVGDECFTAAAINGTEDSTCASLWKDFNKFCEAQAEGSTDWQDCMNFQTKNWARYHEHYIDHSGLVLYKFHVPYDYCWYEAAFWGKEDSDCAE